MYWCLIKCVCVCALDAFFCKCVRSIHWLSLCVSAYLVVKSQFRVLLTNQHCSVVGPVLGSRSVNRQLLGALFAAKTFYENIRSYPIPPNTALRSQNVSLFLIPCHCHAKPVAFYSKAIVIKWEPILASIAPMFPRISSHLTSPSLHYFRDASIFVPPANNSFHPPLHRFPPNYCMSPFHPAAPSFPNHSLHLLSLGLHHSLSLWSLCPSSSSQSGASCTVSLCAGLIFYELLDDGCSLLGKQPQLSPPDSPHACSSVNPLGNRSLSSLSPLH